MSEFVSACIKKNPGAAYNLQFYDMFRNRTTHVCSVYVYESYLGLMVPCAAVTNLLHGSSVIVFCCHSGEL